MITKTYVVKMSAEGGIDVSRDLVSEEINKVTFVRPAKTICIDRDIPDFRLTQEDLYNQEELDEAFVKGTNEAWKLARKIMTRRECGGYTIDELRKAFDVTEVVPDRDVAGVCIIMEDFATAASNLKKVELQRKKQIAVGDLVRVHCGINPKYDGRLGLVIGLRKYSCELNYKIVFDDGDVSLYTPDAVDYVKTVGFNEFFSEKEVKEYVTPLPEEKGAE